MCQIDPIIVAWFEDKGINLNFDNESEYKGVKKGKYGYYYAKIINGFLFPHIEDKNLKEGTKFKFSNDPILREMFNILGENANIRGTPLVLDKEFFRFIDLMRVFELSVVKVDGLHPSDVKRYDFTEETRRESKARKNAEEELVYYSSDEEEDN
jgi:hypothetical protein